MGLKEFFMGKTLTTKGQTKPTTKVAAAPVEEHTFEYGGKKYKAIKGAIIRLDTGMRELTAADIAVSEEAQEYAIKNKCSCVQEVVE
jgi:hypothetical protein